MKRLICMLAALMLSMTMAAAFAEDVDVTSSASTYSWTGEEIDIATLMETMSTQGGFKAIATTNEDGSPNVGCFGYIIAEYEDKYYVTCNFSPDTTRTNILNGSPVLAIYAAPVAPSEDGTPVSMRSGAHLWLKPVEDETLSTILMPRQPAGDAITIVFDILQVAPLG